EDGIRDRNVTGVQTCALPISSEWWLGGCYVLLIATVTAYAVSASRWQKAGWRTLGVWMLLGLALPLVPQRDRGLTCQFLPVGHRSEERRVGKECGSGWAPECS